MNQSPRATGPAPITGLARITGLVALAFVLLAGAAVDARAANDPALAKKLYTEARDLKEAGDIRGSLLKLEEAHEAYPSDAILISIANRHLDLGEPEEAAAVLSRIQPKSSKMKREVARLREDVEVKLAEPVAVRITADAMSAQVSIDGSPFRDLPAKVQLPRGSHRFVVQAPGREEVTVVRDLRGSIEVPLVVPMKPLAGRWRVATEPATSLDKVRVLIAGQTVALTGEERQKPVSDTRTIPPGTYNVTCLKGFDSRADATIKVVAGEVAVATCTFTATPKKHKLRPWAWASGAGAAVALGIGTWALVTYLDEKDEFPSEQFKVESTKPMAAGLSYGIGVGLGITSAILFAKD